MDTHFTQKPPHLIDQGRALGHQQLPRPVYHQHRLLLDILEIIIAKAGKPIARLVSLAPEQRGPRKLGIARGQFKIPEDFDQTYAEEIRKMFEGEDQP